LNPTLAQVHSDLAAVLSSRGNFEGAANEYRRAIQLNPEAYEAHLSLGLILARDGNMAEARPHIAKAAQSPDPEVRQTAQKALH
jgi:Flp pilus assembly protein TadD